MLQMLLTFAALSVLIIGGALVMKFLERTQAAQGGDGNPKSTKDYSGFSKQPALLTPAERSFYGVLKMAVGERALICPKPRMSDVIKAPGRRFNEINQMHVDFLVCDPDTTEPLLAIELDDKSHERAKGITRDTKVNAIFDAAGLGILHIKAARVYEPSAIRQALTDHLPQLPKA